MMDTLIYVPLMNSSSISVFNTNYTLQNNDDESTRDVISNVIKHQYLVAAMGEKRRDLGSVGVLTFVYALIFVTGISGNVCTCVVIARNQYMHTATNYYLFSLAVSDMLTLVFGLPTELYGIWEAYPWRFGEPVCIFKSFLSEMTSYASILTITAFTIERYVAICHPIKTQTLSNLSRAMKTVLTIWILACTFALPYPIHTRVFPYVVVNGTELQDSLQCNIPFKWQRGMTYVFQISTFLFFVFPMLVITVMYALIGLKLRQTELDSKHKSKIRARRAVVRMLVAVVVAFFVQWAPFHAQRLMTSYMPPENWTPSLIAFQSDLFYISGVLYFCNSTINPILYNSMSKKFRLAFKRTLCRCCFTTDELLEINGKSKSVYCSDRAVPHAQRNASHLTGSRMTYVDMKGGKLHTGFTKPLTYRERSYIDLNQTPSPQRRLFYQSCSTGKLNDVLLGGDTNRNHVNLTVSHAPGFGSKAADLRQLNSTNSSLVSFAELETDSVIELKSLSSFSVNSTNGVGTKILVSPHKHNKRKGSFI